MARSADRALAKLPVRDRERVEQRIAILADDPRPPQSRRLVGGRSESISAASGRLQGRLRGGRRCPGGDPGSPIGETFTGTWVRRSRRATLSARTPARISRTTCRRSHGEPTPGPVAGPRRAEARRAHPPRAVGPSRASSHCRIASYEHPYSRRAILVNFPFSVAPHDPDRFSVRVLL